MPCCRISVKTDLPAHEIIVVDDGSTDTTCTLLTDRYGSLIKLINKKDNTGVSAARNIGIEQSTGDWIALLDSDDEWMESKLAAQKNALQNRSEPLCHTEEIWIRNGIRVNPMKKHKKYGGKIFKHCLPLCAISPSSVILNKQVLLDIGGFDESLPACEDYDLWLRICAQHPVLFIPEPQLIKHGGHDDQLSRQHWGMDRFRIQSMQKLLDQNLLNPQQTELTQKHLLKKANILLKGAIKHNNTDLIETCTRIIEQQPHHQPLLTAQSQYSSSNKRHYD